MSNLMRSLVWMVPLASSACALESKPVGVEMDTGSSGSGSTAGESTAGESESSMSASSTSTSATSGTETGFETETEGPDRAEICGGAFEASWDTWRMLIDQQFSDAYIYTRVETYSEGDDQCGPQPDYYCEMRTTISVVEGVISSREMTVTPLGDTPAEECPEPYSEVGDEIGSHSNGGPPRTMDQLYDACCDSAVMLGGFGEFGQTSYTVDETFGVLSGCSDLYCDDCGCFEGTAYTIEDLAFAN